MNVVKSKHKSNPLKPPFPAIHVDKSKPLIKVYTDGGCIGNGKDKNRGAYGFVIVENGGVTFQYSRKLLNTTNNQCELQAIIDCIHWLQDWAPDNSQVIIHSDSQYCIHGICTWRHGWIKKNWKDVKNPLQWKELSRLVDELPNVMYKWVKAHGEGITEDSKWNNYVDELCTETQNN